MLTAAHHQQRGHEGVEVREAGRALKVQSDVPHLVSLGGGRLSTAVTLHPLEPGRMTIGSGQEVDIVVQGTGVETEHCYIENVDGVVTMYPMAEMTSVDGVRVMTPTRLTQGSMVCIGRSNYMRFNHPAEARLMRSALPNTRISMVPLNFYNASIPGVENVDGVDRKPPMAPRRSPRDSWGDVSNSSSCSEDCWGSNGKITRPNGGYATGNGIQQNGSAFASNVKTSAFSNAHNGRQTPDSRSGTPGLTYEDNRSLAERRLGPALPGLNTSARETEYRILTTPSPAFNRNPSPGIRGNFRSSTPTPRAVEQVREELTRRVSSPTPSYGSNCSLEELAARKDELEHKRNQAQAERLREQETEKNERARLEEILSMCADYERQVQLEKQCKSPGIPQNRIKTNGSLPRDKRLLSEDEIVSAEVFTFEQSLPVAAPPAAVPLLSPRTLNGSTRSPYENVVLTSGGIVYPQSPRTRIRTIASKETTPIRDTFEVIENRLALANDYELVSSLPRRNKPQHQSVQNCRPSTPQQLSIQVNSRPSTPQQSVHKDNTSTSQQHSPYMNVPSPKRVPTNRAMPNGSSLDTTPNERDRLILPLDLSPVDRLSEALEAMKSQRSNDRHRSVEVNKELDGRDVTKLLPTGEKANKDDDQIRKENTMEMVVEYESLRKERGKLLAAMSGLKRNITEIEQQDEEMLRELEMERALVDGEWVAQREKLSQEQLRHTELRRQLAQLDQEVVRFSERELQRQAECEARLTAAEEKLNLAKLELSSCGDDADTQKLLTEKVRIHGELLEQEKKMFEDLEFRHLEEEADCLAGHEELQRELSCITQRLDSRQTRLAELESQRMDADHGAQLESQGLERSLIKYLRQLEEVRNRLREIESKLAELSSQGLFNNRDSSPDASSDNDEYARPNSAQSPEDIARISRVTQGAPLEFSTGSLGRKTLESLQAIERNRQIHLEQQGGAVIENERKRVQALKRRVQDEARAQWAEEQRQRENNCYSLNSVGSDEASSDVPTESASSDDTVEKATPLRTAVDGNLETRQLDSSAPLRESMREKELELERNREESRPLTDGSDYEQQLSVSMRDRDKAARLQQQRPLTRYLPIRSDRLDLRQHIETAGHQVDLCSDVSLDTTSCRGFLHKFGAKFHSWGKRWFVFDRTQRTLTYYTDRNEKKARGGAYFQAIAEVYVDHLNSVKAPNPQLTFVVKTSERVYHLMAPSPEAMRIWVDVIFTGAEGYQEFEHGT